MSYNVIRKIRATFSVNEANSFKIKVHKHVHHDQCLIPSFSPSAVSSASPCASAVVPARHYEKFVFYDDFYDIGYYLMNYGQCAPKDTLVKVNHDLPFDMVSFDIKDAMSDNYYQFNLDKC